MTGFGKEHEAVRQAVRQFVDQRIVPNVDQWEQAGCVPRELFREFGELGYLGIRLSEEGGGQGLDFWYTAILVEELVRCGSIGVPVSLLAHAEFATKVIDHVGSPLLIEEFVRPAAAGEMIGALGVTEPHAGSDVAALRTRAVRDGDDYVINGSKVYTTNGTIADFVTTAVRTGDEGHKGISLIVIPTTTEGFSSSRLTKLGTHASDTAEVAFHDCRVPARYLVGEENTGFVSIMKGFEAERLILALMATAQMRVMWEEARRYGHERSAFGHSLLGFQVWRHRLADVATTIEASEALTYRALDLYVRGEPCNGEVSMAKLFATESALDAARECAQIFGGIGYMEECLMARLHRDCLAFTIGAGSSEVLREIVAATKGLNEKS